MTDNSTQSNTMVFVYGTLRRGGSNHHRMEKGKWRGTATVSGKLYRVDWYPALALDPDAGAVSGDLIEVPEDQLPQLDDYEGSEYRRVRAQALNDAGEAVDVWLWEWREGTAGLQLVAGGDWLAVNPD